jgi:hypothetical protein
MPFGLPSWCNSTECENEMLRRTEKVLDEGVTLHDQGLHGNKIKMMK